MQQTVFGSSGKNQRLPVDSLENYRTSRESLDLVGNTLFVSMDERDLFCQAKSPSYSTLIFLTKISLTTHRRRHTIRSMAKWIDCKYGVYRLDLGHGIHAELYFQNGYATRLFNGEKSIPQDNFNAAKAYAEKRLKELLVKALEQLAEDRV